MIWRASKNCTPPHLFFFFFPLLLRNFVCDRPCRMGLFVPQNSRELAEKHHQADSQRVSSGGGGAHSGWTPTWDIPWRWRAVNKHPKPEECKARNPVWDGFNFGWQCRNEKLHKNIPCSYFSIDWKSEIIMTFPIFQFARDPSLRYSVFTPQVKKIKNKKKNILKVDFPQ